MWLFEVWLVHFGSLLKVQVKWVIEAQMIEASRYPDVEAEGHSLAHAKGLDVSGAIDRPAAVIVTYSAFACVVYDLQQRQLPQALSKMKLLPVVQRQARSYYAFVVGCAVSMG